MKMHLSDTLDDFERLLQNFFASTRPIRLAVGAIDNPDQSEQVFEQYDTSEVLEKIFSDNFSMACRKKMLIFWYFQGL